MANSTLSPRGALIVGPIFAAVGVGMTLGALGFVPMTLTEGTPVWVGVAAGVMFVLGGAALVVGFAIGRSSSDGDFVPGTPFAVRCAQFLIGFGISGLMTAITSWIAFGPGKREFSMTLNLPFLPMRWASGEMPGRAMFGLGAVLMAAFWISMTIIGGRRLYRSRTETLPPG